MFRRAPVFQPGDGVISPVMAFIIFFMILSAIGYVLQFDIPEFVPYRNELDLISPWIIPAILGYRTALALEDVFRQSNSVGYEVLHRVAIGLAPLLALTFDAGSATVAGHIHQAIAFINFPIVQNPSFVICLISLVYILLAVLIVLLWLAHGWQPEHVRRADELEALRVEISSMKYDMDRMNFHLQSLMDTQSAEPNAQRQIEIHREQPINPDAFKPSRSTSPQS